MKKLVLTFTFLAIFILFVRPPTDPDLFWHLRYGEEILKAGQIPYGDQFSFTFPGYPWANSYWLSEVLIFFLVSKTGFLFPTLFFALLAAATFFAISSWAEVEKVNFWAASGAAFLGAVVVWPILGLRPQTLSLVLLGLVFILLHQFWLKKRPRLIFFLPLIFLFWANLHAGFNLGLSLIWLFWLTEGCRILMRKFFRTPLLEPLLTTGQLKILLGINLLSTLVTLVNPYGVGLWQTILNDAASPQIKNQINEWLAPDSHSELGLLFFLYFLSLILLAWWQRKKLHPTRLAMLLLFALFALAAVRHVSVFILLSTPFLTEEIAALPWRRINSPYKKLVFPLFLLFFSLLWGLQFLPQTFKASKDVKSLAAAGNYPYEAVNFLKEHPQERMFNEYGWGGFLIWQLPENKTFIDGRMPGWKRDERGILEDYGKVTDLKEGFEKILDFWRVESILTYPNYALAQYLKIHPNWEKIYEDKTAIIFTRR